MTPTGEGTPGGAAVLTQPAENRGDGDPLSLKDAPEFVVLWSQLAERGAHRAAALRVFAVLSWLLPG